MGYYAWWTKSCQSLFFTLPHSTKVTNLSRQIARGYGFTPSNHNSGSTLDGQGKTSISAYSEHLPIKGKEMGAG